MAQLFKNLQKDAEKFFFSIYTRKAEAQTLLNRFIDDQERLTLLPNKFGNDIASDIKKLQEEIEIQVYTLNGYKNTLEQVVKNFNLSKQYYEEMYRKL